MASAETGTVRVENVHAKAQSLDVIYGVDYQMTLDAGTAMKWNVMVFWLVTSAKNQFREPQRWFPDLFCAAISVSLASESLMYYDRSRFGV